MCNNAPRFRGLKLEPTNPFTDDELKLQNTTNLSSCECLMIHAEEFVHVCSKNICLD